MDRLQVLVFLITTLVTIARGSETTREGCTGPVYKINNVDYIREDLIKDVRAADSLSYDHSTNTLFIAYSRTTKYPMREELPAKFNLDTKEFQVLDGVKITMAVTVDAKTNDVYITGRNNIYKYDKNSHKAELFFASNKSISTFVTMLYAKDALYFSGFPSYTLYKMENGELEKVKGLAKEVKSVVIDDDDNYMFFKNESGVYSLQKGSEEVVYYQGSDDLPDGGVTRDSLGKIYAFGQYAGIYTVNTETKALENFMDSKYDNVRALTFDRDNNIIYSDYDTVYRLKPNTDPNCV